MLPFFALGLGMRKRRSQFENISWWWQPAASCNKSNGNMTSQQDKATGKKRNLIKSRPVSVILRAENKFSSLFIVHAWHAAPPLVSLSLVPLWLRSDRMARLNVESSFCASWSIFWCDCEHCGSIPILFQLLLPFFEFRTMHKRLHMPTKGKHRIHIKMLRKKSFSFGPNPDSFLRAPSDNVMSSIWKWIE